MPKDREQDKHEHEHEEAVERTKPTPKPDRNAPNPPRTTTGPLTAPKFGSAGSGGAELEPGPERD